MKQESQPNCETCETVEFLERIVANSKVAIWERDEEIGKLQDQVRELENSLLDRDNEIDSLRRDA